MDAVKVMVMALVLVAAAMAAPNNGKNGVGMGLALANGDIDICEILCNNPERKCPASCPQSPLSPWSKRSLSNRFDDFSYPNLNRRMGAPSVAMLPGIDARLPSFDDYLFMKLLGRKLDGRK